MLERAPDETGQQQVGATEGQEATVLLVPPDILAYLPLVAQATLRQEGVTFQESFVREFRRRSKKVASAYVCWFLFGCHYAYMGNWLAQLLFWLTGGGFVLWWLIDFLRIPSIVHGHNRSLALDLLRDLKLIAS